MRPTAAVTIAFFIVVFALAGCVRTNIAPSPAAVSPHAVAAPPPAIESAAPPAAALEPHPVAAPPSVAATPAPAPAASAAPKTVSRAPAPPKIAPPPTLDLASLETRLRATRAIGVFTKLSLKNQVSDLFDQFKTFHHGGAPPLTMLRQEYDLLLLKVLSLLQDNDASLASAVLASRESIWGMLADPAKFATLG